MAGVYAEVAELDPVACIRRIGLRLEDSPNFDQSSIYFGRLAR